MKWKSFFERFVIVTMALLIQSSLFAQTESQPVRKYIPLGKIIEFTAEVDPNTKIPILNHISIYSRLRKRHVDLQIDPPYTTAIFCITKDDFYWIDVDEPYWDSGKPIKRSDDVFSIFNALGGYDVYVQKNTTPKTLIKAVVDPKNPNVVTIQLKDVDGQSKDYCNPMTFKPIYK